MKQIKKRFSSLRFRNQVVDLVNEDVLRLINIYDDGNSALSTDNKSNNALLTSCEQLKIIDIGTKILNSQLKYDLLNIETILLLFQERICDIFAKLSKAIEALKSWKGIGELLKNNIEKWIQR